MPSQRNLAGGMVKEPYAEILFQRFDLQPYRGLGEEKIFGALRKFRCSATTRNTFRRKFSNCASGDYPPESGALVEDLDAQDLGRVMAPYSFAASEHDSERQHQVAVDGQGQGPFVVSTCVRHMFRCT